MSLVFGILALQAQIAADGLRGDIAATADAIARGHRNPWHSIDKRAFEQQGAALAGHVPALSRAAARFRLAQWVAMVGDAHTLAPLLPIAPDGFCAAAGQLYLPLRFEWFDDGLFVVGAASPHAGLLGRRVTEIAGVAVEAALRRAATALPHRSPGFAREYAPEWLMSEAVLIGSGLAQEGEPIVIGTADAPPTAVEMVPCQPFDWLHTRTAGPAAGASWHAMAEPGGGYRGDLIAPFHADRVRGIKIHELRVPDRADAAAFFDRRMPDLSNDALFIVDLRDAIGGDGTLIPAFLQALERRLGADWPRRTAVLQGRRTHSAGIMLLSELRRRGVPSFGQPTGDAPSHYGETEMRALPAFGLTLLYASAFYDTDRAGDRRPAIAPRHPVPFRFADFAAERDPVIAAARAAWEARP